MHSDRNDSRRDSSNSWLNEHLAYKALNPAHSAFKSKSLQRPYDDHPTPGPGTHTPNFTSVEANMRDSGNSFRSENVRSHLDLDKASHPDHICGAKSIIIGGQ